ncbi:amidohydrolase family protein [Clostridioides difficile]|nr:amidohydrolase family protein [Clostridioides difficile]
MNAAYQYFEEDKKGSIKEGKLANLIILDENPLTIDPMKIKDIKVLQTIREGEVLYSLK